jgi:hypothetical protein
MPKLRKNNAIRLEFEAASLAHLNLSGAAFTGDWLWVAGDESAGIERLQRLEPIGSETLRFGAATSFALADLLDLPGAPDDEADIEGLAVCDGWLWLVGSHGLKRKNAKPDKDDADNAKRLTRVTLDGNRRLLARVPIETEDGVPRLVRKAADGRRAMRLKGDSEQNQLTRLLADDPHLGPFLAIPGKDNGFDIEGLAVNGNRLLLGLRGPVLRGWALLLEVAVEAHRDELRLAPLDDHGEQLRKHFLQLNGLGTRDLHFAGDDLFVLADRPWCWTATSGSSAGRAPGTHSPTTALPCDSRRHWKRSSSCRTRRARTAPRPSARRPGHCRAVHRPGSSCMTPRRQRGVTASGWSTVTCCRAPERSPSEALSSGGPSSSIDMTKAPPTRMRGPGTRH